MARLGLATLLAVAVAVARSACGAPNQTIKTTNQNDGAPANLDATAGAKHPPPYRLVGRTTLDAPVPRPDQARVHSVLVLGSTGLVGRSLTRVLRHGGYRVVEARHRYDVDLRLPGSMDAAFDGVRIDFAFFLACEVGGSKYMHSQAAAHKIDTYNRLMYANVFPYLHRRRIPYLFSSSMHSALDTLYGSVKRAGELAALDGTGKVVKFWNVFGYERAGPRSHVLADWLHSCAATGGARALTNGWERRQFVHADDLARALVDMMAAFQRLPLIVDATSGHWVTMKRVADVIGDATGGACRIRFGHLDAAVAQEVAPTNLWHVASDLPGRVADMWHAYSAQAGEGARREPYVAILVLGGRTPSATRWHRRAVEANLRADVAVATLSGNVDAMQSCVADNGVAAAAQVADCLAGANLLAALQKLTAHFVLIVHASVDAPRSVLTWLARENMDPDLILLAPTALSLAHGSLTDCADDCAGRPFAETAAAHHAETGAAHHAETAAAHHADNVSHRPACHADNVLCFSVWHRPTVLRAARLNAPTTGTPASLSHNGTRLHIRRVEDCACTSGSVAE